MCLICFLWAQGTLEKCSVCKQTITDRMLKATGNSYHPQCFTCVMCHTPLEGASFIVDQANQPHCVDDYHRYGESVCMCCLKEGRFPHTCLILLPYGVGLPMRSVGHEVKNESVMHLVAIKLFSHLNFFVTYYPSAANIIVQK